MEYIDYRELHRDTINKLHQMVNSGKITVETACSICADFVPESEDESIRKALIEAIRHNYVLTGSINHIPTKDILAWLGEKGTNGNEREIPNLEPPLTIKHAKEVMGIKQDDAWSEEDEQMYIATIYELAGFRGNEVKLDWLKSLKERYTWKPSDEQMKALKEACDEHWEPDGLDPLYTLYQDLKKLIE